MKRLEPEGIVLPSSKAQVEHFVAYVLLPRVDDIMEAVTDGASEREIREIFSSNIEGSLKFFFNQWTPWYQEAHGLEATAHATETLQALRQDVISGPIEQLQVSIVKTIWYLLSLSLEDMEGVPVFSDHLTFSQLQSAIKSATRRIN